MANASLQQHLATIKQASNKRTKHTVVRLLSTSFFTVSQKSTLFGLLCGLHMLVFPLKRW